MKKLLQGAKVVNYVVATEHKNELHGRVLPLTIVECVQLMEAHLFAGSNYHFVPCQFLLMSMY